MCTKSIPKAEYLAASHSRLLFETALYWLSLGFLKPPNEYIEV